MNDTPMHSPQSLPGNVSAVKRPVAIVDDDRDMRESVAAMLEASDIEAVCFSSGESFVQSGIYSSAACIVLDLRLGDRSGLQVLDEIDRGDRHCAPVVFVTGHGDVQTAVNAMKNSLVLDFVEKPFDPTTLVRLVRRGIDLDRRLRGSEKFTQEFKAKLESLSPREREVLERLADGDSNKSIAFGLDISPKTVATHRAHLLDKFGVHNILDVVCPLRRIRAETLPRPEPKTEGAQTPVTEPLPPR